jgi:alpha-beta hydrolase superfamily lysophospholipase
MTRRLLLLTALAALACPPAKAEQTVNFTSSDGCELEAFYQAPSTGSYVFITAHGLGSNKNEWGSFQDALEERGQGYLSLDLRGHGASLTCGEAAVDYKNFTKTDWNKVYRDIEAGAAWLKKKGVPAKKMVFCGASVGANLALKAAAQGKLKPAAVVLLSPGLDYAGVTTENNLAAKQPFRLLIAASQDDPYAWQSRAWLAKAAGAKGLPVSLMEGQSGHGVNMFKAPELMTDIIDWVLRTPGRQAK